MYRKFDQLTKYMFFKAWNTAAKRAAALRNQIRRQAEDEQDKTQESSDKNKREEDDDQKCLATVCARLYTTHYERGIEENGCWRDETDGAVVWLRGKRKYGIIDSKFKKRKMKVRKDSGEEIL